MKKIKSTVMILIKHRTEERQEGKQSNIVLHRKMDEFFREKLC